MPAQHRATLHRPPYGRDPFNTPTIREYDAARQDRIRGRDYRRAGDLEAQARQAYPWGLRAHGAPFVSGVIAVCFLALLGFSAAQASADPEPAFAGVVEATPTSVTLPAFRCAVPDTESVVARSGSRVRPAKTGGGK